MPDLQVQQQQTELQLRDDQQQQKQKQKQQQQQQHHHQQHQQHQQNHQEYQRKPSILEDPNAAPIPAPNQNVHLNPRAVYLRDHVSVATIHPVTHPSLIPASLITFLLGQFNEELERGDTYPLDQPMTLEQFGKYWFGTFAAVMLMGSKEETNNLLEERDWSTQCLGTFYIKPNYPGRSSHVCSGGFLTTHASRGKGCGKHMGEAYLEYAPKLGFTYSIFNLVYETNTASLKIWDGLGFKRIGKVKGAGRLRGHGQPVDAVIYGRDLNDDDDYVSDERFDKIRFYLEKGKYPPTADRSEKSRLRSAATHYKLDNGRLMLKDKEVISDGQMQYEIARSVHCQAHGGINKTTASIAEKYHWVRIKETVSQVIRNCAECKEHAKAPVVRGERFSSERAQPSPQQQLQSQETARAASITQTPSITQVAQMDIPVDPAMMEDVQHTNQFAPVANMNPTSEEPTAAGQTPQHAAAVAAARAALNEGAALTEEDRTMRDRHLMETLMAEMKREPAAEAAVVVYQDTDVDREVERQLQAGMEIER